MQYDSKWYIHYIIYQFKLYQHKVLWELNYLSDELNLDAILSSFIVVM